MKAYKLVLPLLLALAIPAVLSAGEHEKGERHEGGKGAKGWTGDYAKPAADAKDSIGTLKAGEKTYTLKGSAEVATKLAAWDGKSVHVMGTMDGDVITVTDARSAGGGGGGGGHKEGERK